MIVDRLTKNTQTEPPAGFVIVGARMTGKSALLRHLVSQLRTAPRPADPTAAPGLTQTPVLLDCALLNEPGDLWRRLYAATQQMHPQDAPEATNHESGGAEYHPMLALIQQLRQQGCQVTLLLDNVDSLLTASTHAFDLCTGLTLLKREAPLILTTEKPLYDLNRSLAGSRLTLETTQLFLGLVEAEAAEQWLTYHLRENEMARAERAALLASTGRHPYLLHKVGDCMAEMEAMLPPDRVWRVEHLPFIRLRLAEHGRPLFLAQWELLSNPPPPLTVEGVAGLLERLRRGPLPPDGAPAPWLPVLNWLINQALVTYRWEEDRPVYTLFSPLLLDFLNHASPPLIDPSPPALAPVVDPAVYQDLTKIEATLLRYFEQHSQKVVSIDQLLADVWRRPNASTRRVQEAIRRLRIQLEQQTSPIGEIKNERGRGYRFVPARPTTSPNR